MSSPCALLVEDTEEFVAIGTRLLENEGYLVTVARDGAEAVRLARSHSPELILLDTLARAPRRAFSRRALLAQVWGEDWFGDDHVVDVHLANLRRKIGEPASSPKHIKTVRGVGYRFDP